jgi:hypothetical protein
MIRCEYRGLRVAAAVAAAGLPVLAVATACVGTMRVGVPIAIEKPSLLIVASILIVVPSRRERIRALQGVMALYLICIPMNEIHLRYFSVLGPGIRASCSAVPLTLLAVAYLADWSLRPDAEKPWTSGFRDAWLLAGGIILAHMAVLGLLLHRFYGYGYEQDLRVLGSLALYFLIFLTSRRPLSRPYVRQAIGLILVVFFAMLAAGQA